MSQLTTAKKPDQQQQGEGSMPRCFPSTGLKTIRLLLPCTISEFRPPLFVMCTTATIAVQSKRFSLNELPSKNVQPSKFGNGIN
jgi:hypothetical protein